MDNLAGHIVLLSGSPGSGKTTLAEALAHQPGCPKVHIHSDDFWGYIKAGKIDPWLPQSHAQNQMVNAITADVAARYAANGYLTIVDGVIRPWWLPAFVRLGMAVHYLVLRTTREEAVRRCLARGGDSLTDPDVVSDLHAQFADLGPYEPHVLDVEGLDEAAALAAVSAGLASQAYRLRP